jgi:hypothetical protein
MCLTRDGNAQTQAWLHKQGIDADEWGLGVAEDEGAPQTHEQTEKIIGMLRAM